MSEIENGKLSLYGTKHWKCDHLMTLGFKGLNKQLQKYSFVRMQLTVTGHTKEDHWYTRQQAL